MAASLRILVALLVASSLTPASATQTMANPIRKVVTLLQAMQKKVTAEGEKEKELYDKFMCYCKTNNGALSESIAAAEAKMPNVLADIEAAEAKLAQSKEDLKQAQADREAAKKAMAEATAIREKEAAAFAAAKADDDANIAAIAKAVAAVEAGMAGSFLQTPAAAVLRKLVQSNSNMVDDQQELVAFLEASAGYAPQSGEIVGILKQMGDTMAADLAEITKAEDEAIKSYEGLMAAKTKEVEALTARIEDKTKLIGELGMEIVQMKEDLDDTAKGLMEDKKFLAELEKGCGTKEAEWEERKKVRAEELLALADTIKVLNDDDALDLFKKTLPSPESFLQVQVTQKAMRDRAMAALREAQKKAPRQARSRLDFLVLALSGKQALSQKGFEKVVKMIDEMVAVLKQEQVDDENKKEYCATSLDAADDKKKGLERQISDTKKAIASLQEAIATATEEIAALEAGIKALDKQVAEATEQRKEENTEFKALMASDTAAVELLGFAKNRLNKFYNPKLYKAAPKRELSREDRIAVNMGGTPPPTAAPGGIAGTGVTVFAQIKEHVQAQANSDEAPPPPPATWDAYAKKSEESTGVISMIDLLIADLEKEMTVAQTEEKNAQQDYEELMADSAEKRTTDSKALEDKTAAKAEMQTDLVAAEGELKAGTQELMATLKYIGSLHAECDWLVQYFDVRKEARAGEIDSLVKAKAILSGADYSLIQTSRRGNLRH